VQLLDHEHRRHLSVPLSHKPLAFLDLLRRRDGFPIARSKRVGEGHLGKVHSKVLELAHLIASDLQQVLRH
jgi:hypothetical protein